MQNFNVLIRKVTIDDLEVIQQLNKLLFEYERRFGDTFNLGWPYSEDGINYFKERINKDGLVLVAEVDKKLVGYICGTILNLSYRSVNPIAELENMFVLEEFRGRGIGSSLLNEFIRVTKENGAKKFKVIAIFQNKKAVDFYKKNRFKDFEHVLETE